MRILILGGGGNIGAWLEQAYAACGHHVVSVSRRSNRAKRSFPSISSIERVFENLEVFFESKKFSLLAPVDLIVDFVCYTEEDAKKRLHWLSEYRGVYCLISSVAVYERHHKLNEITASSACESQKWSYAKKKRLIEHLIQSAKTKFELVVARLGHTYDTVIPFPFGPSDWTIAEYILGGGPLLVHKICDSVWSIQHSIDASSRLKFLLDNLDNFQRIVNIVSVKRTSWCAVYKSILKALGVTYRVQLIPPKQLLTLCRYWGESVFYHKQFDECYSGEDVELLEEQCPETVNLEAGIQNSIDFYMSAGAITNFESKALFSYATLAKLAAEKR